MQEAKKRSTKGLGIEKTNFDFLRVRLKNKWPYQLKLLQAHL